MHALNKFLGKIAQETDGFSIGDPWYPPIRNTIACMLPIVRQTQLPRQYVTISEPDQGLIMEDTGTIDRVKTKNTTEKYIFIPAGQMLAGDTQPRAIARGIVLSPGQEQEVPVVCVHHSCDISSGAGMTLGPDVPREIEQELYDSKMAVNVDRQHRVWEEIKRVGSDVPSRPESNNLRDDLRSNFSSHVEKMRASLDQVPEIPGQVGMAVIVGSGIYSVQCFDSPDSWRERRKALIEKEVSGIGRTADDASSIQRAGPDDIKNILRAFVSQDFEPDPITTVTGWQTLAMDSGNHAGEATVIDGSVIHFSLGLKPVSRQLESISAERNYGRGFVHADHVTKLSLELYKSMLGLPGFPRSKKSKTDLFLLRAAGYLHDVGFPPEERHNKNGFNWLRARLEKPDMLGILSETERTIILHCVLWHRGSDWAPNREVKLNPQDLMTARRLAGVLRIADGLCFPYGAPTRRVGAFQEKSVIVIEACPSKHDGDLSVQIKHATDKKDLLEEVLTTTRRSDIVKVEVRKCSPGREKGN